MIKIDYSEKTDYKHLAKLGFISGLLVLGPPYALYILAMGFIHWSDGSLAMMLYSIVESVLSIAFFSAFYLAIVVPWGLRVYSIVTGKEWQQ